MEKSHSADEGFVQVVDALGATAQVSAGKRFPHFAHPECI